MEREREFLDFDFFYGGKKSSDDFNCSGVGSQTQMYGHRYVRGVKCHCP